MPPPGVVDVPDPGTVVTVGAPVVGLPTDVGLPTAVVGEGLDPAPPVVEVEPTEEAVPTTDDTVVDAPDDDESEPHPTKRPPETRIPVTANAMAAIARRRLRLR